MDSFATQTIVSTLQNLVTNISQLNATLKSVVPYMQISPVTFANLPSQPSEGMIAAITDSSTNTWGATISGGGGNHVLAYYNAANWTVIGK
jgi:tRNA-binding EMAP/Myf-like protein